MKDFFKNKCEVVRDLLPLYADESCSKETAKAIDIHLVTCPSCRDYLSEIKSYHDDSDVSDIPDSDPHFAEVMNKLRKRKIVRRSLVSAAIITSLAINAVLILTND
ncbi:MAG: zf-HC2 domain-containing protein [Clostridia bacterium]|nr:zf-HC2 domain-containing protein [Clostridia bacterium]